MARPAPRRPRRLRLPLRPRRSLARPPLFVARRDGRAAAAAARSPRAPGGAGAAPGAAVLRSRESRARPAAGTCLLLCPLPRRLPGPGKVSGEWRACPLRRGASGPPPPSEGRAAPSHGDEAPPRSLFPGTRPPERGHRPSEGSLGKDRPARQVPDRCVSTAGPRTCAFFLFSFPFDVSRGGRGRNSAPRWQTATLKPPLSAGKVPAR